MNFTAYDTIKAEGITEENYYRVVSMLMHEQANCLIEQTKEEVLRYWGPDFISDDGTDYYRSNLEAMQHLMDLRYEGTPSQLRYWLGIDKEPADEHANLHDTINDIFSAGGFCDSLNNFWRDAFQDWED